MSAKVPRAPCCCGCWTLNFNDRCLLAVIGTELCISYIDVDLPVAERQVQLQLDYFFTCRCERCQVGGWRSYTRLHTSCRLRNVSMIMC